MGTFEFLPSTRRGFVGRTAAALALSLTTSLPRLAEAEAPLRASDPGTPSDEWMKRLTGKHKQIFDMKTHANGMGLLHVRNYLNTWRDAYHLTDKDVTPVLTFYGFGLPMGFDDAAWAKYPFGDAMKVTDPTTNAPAKRNVFYKPVAGDTIAAGMLDSSIDQLVARGTVCIMCNNALAFWTMQLEKGGAGKAADIRADLVQHLLPGVSLVPGMVIAINQAQERGCAYMALG
ncbi:MAG TPA: hypothetical protein VFU45_05215 [Gemmatimonadales bacterium]|nr:hypothetical protein [Gemmatimonadales bacterium]